jgi:hypothetical protein
VGALKLTASPEAVFLFGPLHTIEVREAKTGIPTGDDIRVPMPFPILYRARTFGMMLRKRQNKNHPFEVVSVIKFPENSITTV